MGIRIFHTKDELLRIFEEFDGEGSDDDAQESTESGGTAVVISQLRHFVIQVKNFCSSKMITLKAVFLQQYVMDPLLLDPIQAFDKERTIDKLSGHKVCKYYSSIPSTPDSPLVVPPKGILCIQRGHTDIPVYSHSGSIFPSSIPPPSLQHARAH